MAQAKAKFKPLSFSTTMRNPDRIAGFMSCIIPFKDKILTNDVITKILKNILKKKLYKPTLVDKVEELKDTYNDETCSFSDTQLDYILKNIKRQGLKKDGHQDLTHFINCRWNWVF